MRRRCFMRCTLKESILILISLDGSCYRNKLLSMTFWNHDCILKVIFFNLNLLFDIYLMEQKCLFHLSHFVSSFWEFEGFYAGGWRVIKKVRSWSGIIRPPLQHHILQPVLAYLNNLNLFYADMNESQRVPASRCRYIET